MNDIFKKNSVLIIFVVVTVIGLLVRYIFGDKSIFWDFFSAVDTASAVALAFLAFLGYREYIKSEDEIKIYFQIAGQAKKDTGLSLLRKECSRGEILGVLGMIQKDSKSRFDIKYMKDKRLLQESQMVQKGESDEFIILVSVDEFAQFDIK